MAKLYVTCYANIDRQSGNDSLPVLVEPPLDQPIIVDFTAGVAMSAESLPSGTQYVEIFADTACHYRFQSQASGPIATVNDAPLGAELPFYRRLNTGTPAGGWGISVIERV